MTKSAPGSFKELLNRTLNKLGTFQERVDQLRGTAQAELAELLALEPSARRIHIHRADDGFRNPVLVDLLIDESKDRIRQDPHAAREVAECAHDVALRLRREEIGGVWAMTCIARANAHRGNALRVAGDLRGAEPLLEVALSLFAQKGNGDPLILGEIFSLLASLRKSQRRFLEAEELLGFAYDLFSECEDREQQAQTLVLRADVLALATETDRAIQTVRKAAEIIDPESNRLLYLISQHNLTLYLEEAGRFREAQELLESNRALYATFDDPATQLRYTWSRGRIARGLGELETAEQALLEVRGGFTSRSMAYDAALAGLDLALVYVESGKSAELRDLAQSMVPVFLSQEVHREALAALMLFQEAARQEAVTSQMVTELLEFLRKVRNQPPQQPS